MKMRFLCLAGLMLAAMAGPAQAGMQTFNGLAGTNVAGYSYNHGTYTSFSGSAVAEIDGFNFGSSTYTDYIIGPNYNSNDSGGVPQNGTDYFLTRGPTVISRVDNATFTFNSIDFGWWNNAANTVITVTGYNGANIVATATLDSLSNSNDNDGNDFENFSFSGFTNLTTLYFSGSDQYFVYDNFQYDASSVSGVPEPTSIAMWSLMGGIGIMVRRKRKKA